MSDETESTSDAPAEMSAEDELGAIFDKANAEETAGGMNDEPTSESQERARDDQGRFVSKDTNEEAADGVAGDATVGAAPEETELADPDAQAGAEPEIPALDAPASWTAAETANWADLTREAQEAVLRREADWQKADGERASKMKGYEPIDAALAPMRQQLQLNGVDPAQYIGQLVTADRMLRDPQTQAQALQWIARQYGLDLSQANQAESNVDPAFAPFVQKIDALESRLSGFAASQQQQEIVRAEAIVEAFKKDPANKYAERLEQQILNEVPAVNMLYPAASLEERLKKAYDRVLRLDDVIQAEIQAEQTAAAEEKRRKESEDKAAKARRVAQTNLSAQGTAGGATPPRYKTPEDELSAIYDQVTGA